MDVAASKPFPLATSKVRVPASLATVVAAPSVIAPVIAFRSADAESRFRTAPVVEMPVPEIVIGSAIDKPVPLRCMAAPLETVVEPAEEPSEESAVSTTTPALMSVVPK